MTEHDVVLGALVGVGTGLLIYYLWDRFSAPERLGRESRAADTDLRAWMETQLRELRGWLEGQFAQGREQFGRHDDRIRALEVEAEVRRQLCDLRHPVAGQVATRTTDPPGFDPSAERCHGGRRQPEPEPEEP